MRKRIFITLLQVVIAISVMGVLTGVHAAEGTPLAVVDNSSYNFGSILEGIDIVHDFKIINKGDADLQIIKIKSG